MRNHGVSFRAAPDVVARVVTAQEAAGTPEGTVRPDLADSPLREYSAEQARAGLLEDAHALVDTASS